MGHYAAEMMCNTCGRLMCVCPRLPVPEDTRWMVRDYSACQAKDVALWERKGATMYATEAEALAAIPAAIDARIKFLHGEISRLEALRPNSVPCPPQMGRV